MSEGGREWRERDDREERRKEKEEQMTRKARKQRGRDRDNPPCTSSGGAMNTRLRYWVPSFTDSDLTSSRPGNARGRPFLSIHGASTCQESTSLPMNVTARLVPSLLSCLGGLVGSVVA